MNKRAFIAEPDQEEALRQAAILKDEGYDAQVFTGTDLVLAVEQLQPDVLVLRHERPGTQTGLALVLRLKIVSPGTAIVLTTSDLTPDAIEKNKKQRVHADWYLRLPADRGELVGAARAVPQVLDTTEASVEEDKSTARDPSRPPPLPLGGLRALATLAKAGPRSGEAVLTAEDLTFVEKVFSSIQHIDTDAPIVEPASAFIADTPDRKLALLRTKLKERERDLAKLSRLWRAREEDLRQQEAKVQQKDIQVEGLRLRISELTSELELAQAALLEKEAEWGRQIGETYDLHSLNEAELIQQVAGKEAEINSLKTKLRKSEDAAAAERKEFTSRVLEWESAYAQLEQHHWKIVSASVDEVVRLQDQVQQREHDKGVLRSGLRDRDNTVAVLRAEKAALKAALFSIEHEAALAEERVVAVVQSALAQEKRKRSLVEDELHEVCAAVIVVEEDLQRHQKLLWWLDGERRNHIARIAQVARVGESELVRLRDEREIYRQRSAQLEEALSMASALGESVAATMFALDDKKSLIAREQIRVRNDKLSQLNEDRVRLEDSVGDLTSRLGQSELDHASENARAEELERDLADTRERAATTETRLQNGLDGMTGDRDRLVDKLQMTDHQLSATREEFAAEKHNHQQRELEFQAVVDGKDGEITARNQHITELDRNLADSKDDVGNLRRTMSIRDERITELLSRVRQADEQQVQLEGQIFRLDASNTEREATIIARDERIALIAERMAQRDEKLDLVEGELKKTQLSVLDHKAQLERQESHLAEVQRQLSSSREETIQTRAETQARSTELFEAERRASDLSAELQDAKGDIAATSAIAEQLQAQLTTVEAHGNELRLNLGNADAKLRASLGELEAAALNTNQTLQELAATKETLSARSAEVTEHIRVLAELGKSRDEVSATLVTTTEMFEDRVRGLSTEKGEIEEQLAQRLTENDALSLSLSDASKRIEEIHGRARQLEGAVADREGRIAAQVQALSNAEQQIVQQQASLGENNLELSELKAAFEDAKRSIDERAKWLATRDQSIVELKASIEAERKQGSEVGTRTETLQLQLHDALSQRTKFEAALAHKEQQLAAVSISTSQALVAEQTKVEETHKQLRRAADALTATEAELTNARAAELRLVEAQKSEAHVRAEYQKLRAQAEKLVADHKTLRASTEKLEGEKKAAITEVDKLRNELTGVRSQADSGAQQAQRAKSDTDLQLKQIAELKAQLQRAAGQIQLEQKQKQDAELDVEETKKQAQATTAAALEGQQAELTRLGKELLDARKAQRDAVAQAQQARAEADQIKKMVAQRLAQNKTATVPPAAAVPAARSMATPAGGLGAASQTPQAARPNPLRLEQPRPVAASDHTDDFDSPTVVLDTDGVHPPDPFESQKTRMVEVPTIPSMARGPSGSTS